MIDRIKELTNTLEQELTNGLNNLPEYQGTLESSDLQISEGRTFINGAQCTLNELQKQLEIQYGKENNNGYMAFRNKSRNK